MDLKDYDMPSDWGDKKTVTSRELRFVHNAISINQDLFIGLISLVVAAIYLAGDEIIGAYLFIVLTVGIMSHAQAKKTNGWNRRVWGMVKEYDKPPLDEIEPDWTDKKTRTADELLNNR